MKVDQISIFIENKSGRLAEITRILGETGINIRALSLADTSDFGILRLIVNDVEKAKAVLKEKGFTVSKTEVVAVEVPDRPGGLADVLETLAASDLSIEYLYCYVRPDGGEAVDIFRVEDADSAMGALEAAGFGLVRASDIYELDEL